MDRSVHSLEIKAVDEGQRIIEGYAAIFGNLDRNGDIIEQGAFDETLALSSSVAVFIGHDIHTLPVGLPLEIRVDAQGLLTKTQVFRTADGDALLETAKALRAAGQTLGMSIGYRAQDFSWEGADGVMVRHIKSLQLVEYSFAAAQLIANPRALVTGVKTVDEETKTAIAPHSTATDKEGRWDGPGAVAAAPNEERVLRYMHAWVDPEGDADAKQTYKFPHHAPRAGAAAVIAGVNNGLARLSQASIPAGNRAGVERHLRKHRDDAGLENDQAADVDLLITAVAVEELAYALTAELLAANTLDLKAGRVMKQSDLDKLHAAIVQLQTVHEGQCDMVDGCPMKEKAQKVGDADAGYGLDIDLFLAKAKAEV